MRSQCIVAEVGKRLGVRLDALDRDRLVRSSQ
jgi:hypothetical protein